MHGETVKFPFSFLFYIVLLLASFKAETSRKVKYDYKATWWVWLKVLIYKAIDTIFAVLQFHLSFQIHGLI